MKLKRIRFFQPLVILAVGIVLGIILSSGLQPVTGRTAPARQNAPASSSNGTALQTQLSKLQDDVARLKNSAGDQAHAMTSVAYHFNNLWFAGKQKNWPLAQFYLNETRSHLRWAVRIIPIRKDDQGREVKLTEILKSVESTPMKQLYDAVKAKDKKKFVKAYRFTLDSCYACHKTSAKPYIKLKIPDHPVESMVAFASEEKGEPQKTSMLIEAAALRQLLQKNDVRILDTRPEPAYDKGHIPGALRVSAKDWKQLGASKGGFHNAKAWGKLVGSLGIDQKTTVIVYGDKITNTARIWWLLKYLGMKDVRILNGGRNIWTKKNMPTSTKTPKVAATKFEPRFQKDRLEEMDTLKKKLKSPKVKIVDTRSEGEYTGKVKRSKRGGHIPGATHLEWKELLAKDGRFKTREQLRELFAKRDILPDKTAICY